MDFQRPGNIYEHNAISVLALYGEFVEGTPNSVVAVVSRIPLSDAARSALEASAERLGYGRGACAWIRLRANDATLGAADLRTIVEGVDPLAVVAADSDAASALSAAYSTGLKLNAVNRVMCRSVAAFSDFDGALGDEDSKQRAWHVLKGLRR